MERTEIRSLVRSILGEELGKIKAKNSSAPIIKQESIRMANDEDLAAFVKRIATLCRDDNQRNKFETGQCIFKLDIRSATPNGVDRSPAQLAKAEQFTQFEKGVINEGQIDALSEDTAIVVIGKSVRLTPLAIDKLRQRGIKLERQRL